jgi:nitronate monooxygenase
MLKNQVMKLFGIEYPIIQAPMAGGVTTSRLVAAVSNSGGLGMIGAGYLSPEQLREQVKEVRQLTSGYFGVNLFVPNEYRVKEKEVQAALERLHPVRSQLKIQSAEPVLPVYEKDLAIFHEQIQVVIDDKVPVCSFTFGIPSEEVIRALKEQNTILIGTATTVKEAIEVEKRGMDMVVVQGSEAGGHRGDFMEGSNESLIGLMSLIPQTVDSVGIPVIAAGGIMDGRGLMACVCLGAKAVQMGTAFLTCIESGAHPEHKAAILKSTEDKVVLTRAFSGKWARGIQNQFIAGMRGDENTLPEFPVQNALTQVIRKTAAAQNNPEYMSLWSGQSPRLAKSVTVEELIKDIMDEAKTILTAVQ